jgi:hypothetical protein
VKLRLSMMIAVVALPTLAGAAPATDGAVLAHARIKRTEIVAADNWTVTCLTTEQRNGRRQCSADLKIYQTDGANGAQTKP